MLLEFTDQNFDNEILKSLVVVDFWNPWCSPCNRLNPIIKSFSEHNSDVVVGKLNTIENPRITTQLRVDAIPTIMFFKDGKLVKRLLGLHSEQQLQTYLNELK